MKDVKIFLPKINCKISTSRLRDAFQAVDNRQTGDIGFDDFTTFFHSLLHDQCPKVIRFSLLHASIAFKKIAFFLEMINIFHVCRFSLTC